MDLENIENRDENIMNIKDKEKSKFRKHSSKIVGSIITLHEKNLIPILEIIIYFKQKTSTDGNFIAELLGFDITCISIIVIENNQEYIIKIQEEYNIDQYINEIPNLTNVINKFRV